MHGVCCFLSSRVQVRALILADMDAVGKEAQLRGFEFVKAIHLDADLFSVENNLLTPTMKLKRKYVRMHVACNLFCCDRYHDWPW